MSVFNRTLSIKMSYIYLRQHQRSIKHEKSLVKNALPNKVSDLAEEGEKLVYYGRVHNGKFKFADIKIDPKYEVIDFISDKPGKPLDADNDSISDKQNFISLPTYENGKTLDHAEQPIVGSVFQMQNRVLNHIFFVELKDNIDNEVARKILSKRYGKSSVSLKKSIPDPILSIAQSNIRKNPKLRNEMMKFNENERQKVNDEMVIALKFFYSILPSNEKFNELIELMNARPLMKEAILKIYRAKVACAKKGLYLFGQKHM